MTEDTTTTHATSVADDVPQARTAARLFHAPSQVRQPLRRESDITPAEESDAAPEDERASGDTGSTPYTLEEHIGQLRALMQTRRAPGSDESGVEPAPREEKKKDVAGARDGAVVGAATTHGREARGKAVGAGLVPAPQVSMLLTSSLSEPRAADLPSSTDTTRVELSKQPPKVKPTRGHAASVARSAGLPGTTNERGDTGEPPSTTERAVVPHVAANERVTAPAPTKESGRAGEAASSKARAPRLTINRLDVQVVNRPEQPPPAPPAPPPTAPPSRPDPWGAPDRQFLGRFFY